MNSMISSLNNVNLSDLGIYVVHVGSGLISTPLLSEQEIIEDYAMNNDTPYYYGVKKSPLEIEITFAKLDGAWTLGSRREFFKILDPEDNEDYIEFYISDEIEKIYYVKYVGGINLNHNGSQQGYITVRFRCDSPFCYSPRYVANYDFSHNIINNFTFVNTGDLNCYPEIRIQKVDSGDISIKNLSNEGKVFELTDLSNGETVYINNEDGTIISDLPNVYRYENHNEVYLEMLTGANDIEITGKCIIELRYYFKIKG